MRLYLVQHGEARPEEEDPERHLTDRGIRDTQKTAAFIQPLGLSVGAVWHSGKPRARQTAEILASAINPGQGAVQRDGLAPKDDVRPLVEALRSVSDDLMIVGHLPFLARLASALLSGNPEKTAVAFKNSGIVCLERSEQGEFSLGWAVVPGILR